MPRVFKNAVHAKLVSNHGKWLRASCTKIHRSKLFRPLHSKNHSSVTFCVNFVNTTHFLLVLRARENPRVAGHVSVARMRGRATDDGKAEFVRPSHTRGWCCALPRSANNRCAVATSGRVFCWRRRREATSITTSLSSWSMAANKMMNANRTWNCPAYGMTQQTQFRSDLEISFRFRNISNTP